MVISTAPATGSLDRFATSLVAALAERLLFLRAGLDFSSSRYITGTLLIAIIVPFSSIILFNHLGLLKFSIRFDSRKPQTRYSQKQ
jgi:hypothetical protein